MPKMILDKKQEKIILVSDSDYELLSKHQWMVNDQGYAYRKLGQKNVWLHRVVAKAPEDKLVDHVDGNPFNNRRSNLRACDYSENGANRKAILQGKRKLTSSFKGVGWLKSHQKWRAQIWTGGRAHGKSIFLGYFDDEIDAAKAYDKAAKIYFGSFARLNFPDSDNN